MKKLLTIFILLIPSMLYAASAWDSGDIKKNSNCNQSKYFAIGKLCQDTDDAKLYKGTGSAVVEISNVVTGLTSASSVAITGGTINGTTIGATTPAAGTFTTIKTMDNIADTTLSGTPKVFVIYDSTGTPYYFKAYPVKQ